MGNIFSDAWKGVVNVHKLLGSAIPGVGPYLSGQETNEANQSIADKTNAANAALWREQSAYNTPTMQMTRLRDAGLNPNLAYGTIAESRASNPPTMIAPEFKAPGTEVAGSVSEGLSKYQQVVNMHTLNAKNNIELATAKAIASKANTDADYAAYELDALKKSGMIKGDSSPLKYGVRRAGELKAGIDNAIDRSSVWQSIGDFVSKASEKMNAVRMTPHVQRNYKKGGKK